MTHEERAAFVHEMMRVDPHHDVDPASVERLHIAAALRAVERETLARAADALDADNRYESAKIVRALAEGGEMER